MVYRTYQAGRRSRLSFFSRISANTSLIILNLIFFTVFFILIILGYDIIDYIALKPSSVLQGMFLWTFLTSMFMHAGFFHLFVNMLSLFFIGILVERIIGPKRYLWFYLVSGLFAGLFFVLLELIFPSNLDVAAVGASGALFGLVGFLMIITPNLPVYIMFIPIPIKMKYAAPGILIVLWLISLAPLAFGSNKIPIGNTAHLGGLIVGLFYGLYLKNKYRNKARLINKHFS